MIIHVMNLVNIFHFPLSTFHTHMRYADLLTSTLDPKRSKELMQSLVTLSTKESGQKLDIDPMSGADRSVRR